MEGMALCCMDMTELFVLKKSPTIWGAFPAWLKYIAGKGIETPSTSVVGASNH